MLKKRDSHYYEVVIQLADGTEETRFYRAFSLSDLFDGIQYLTIIGYRRIVVPQMPVEGR